MLFGYNGRDGVITDENSLLYMRARYYSPDMKRFVNADIIPGEISNAITLNRFAYANGNPVSFVDPFGLSSLRDLWNVIKSSGEEKMIDPLVNAYNEGKAWLDENVVDPFANAYNEGKDALVEAYTQTKEAVSEVYEEVVDLATDTYNTLDKTYDSVKSFIKNEDEQVVLNARYFAFYKGKLAIRTNFSRSASFGILFISHKEKDRWDKEYTVMHEYGHTKQLEQMDIITYALFIGIPSWQKLGPESYYRKPWEITADINGGVPLEKRKLDDPLTQDHIDNGNDYLNIVSSDLPIWEKFNRLKHYYFK